MKNIFIKKLFVIALTVCLASCATFNGGGHSESTHVAFPTNPHTWQYHYLSVIKPNKYAPKTGPSNVNRLIKTDFHQYLVNEQGVRIDLLEDAYILKKDGSYKPLDFDWMEGNSGIRLLNHNNELKAILHYITLGEQLLTDCQFERHNIYFVGDIDAENEMIKFNQSYLKDLRFESMEGMIIANSN